MRRLRGLSQGKASAVLGFVLSKPEGDVHAAGLALQPKAEAQSWVQPLQVFSD